MKKGIILGCFATALFSLPVMAGDVTLYKPSEILGHDYRLQEDSYEATDTTGGLRHYVCSECGDEYSYETAPLVYETNPKTGEPVDQALCSNPVLPDWEHVPDGEPQVYWSKADNEWRVYIYGSHDKSGEGFCGTDYVTWSAPVYDMSDWRYEGVTLDITDGSPYGGSILYAPDCAYDLQTDSYYMIANEAYTAAVLRVASTPEGPYDVEKAVWCGSFKTTYDPSVYIENGTIYVTGACRKTEETVTDASVFAAVNEDGYTAGKGQLGVIYQLKADPTDGNGIERTSWMPTDERIYSPIYEGPSLYGYNEDLGVYLYLYVSVEVGADGTEYNSGIAYMWTDDLMDGTWHYGDNGVEGDILDSDAVRSIAGNHGNVISDTCGRFVKNAETGKMELVDFPTYLHGNNHGSIAKINGNYYFFGHRHSNGHRFSRQAWAGQLNISKNEATGEPVIEPMEFTSSGIADSLNAYAVNATNSVICLLEAYDHPAPGTEEGPHKECAENTPFVMGNRTEGAVHASYLTNLKSGCVAGFKYIGFWENAPSVVKLLVSKEASDIDGSILVYLDAPTEEAGGTKIGTVDVSSASVTASAETEDGSDGKTWYWVEGAVDTSVTGDHAVYFVFEAEDGGTICEFDAFQFQ